MNDETQSRGSLESLCHTLRDELAAHRKVIEALANRMGRLEQSTVMASSEVLAALVDLRAHLVDLTLDGYYPTRMPPKPIVTTRR